MPDTNLFAGIKLTPQTSFPMQNSKLTPSLSLAERWSITEVRPQLISLLRITCSQMSFYKVSFEVMVFKQLKK